MENRHIASFPRPYGLFSKSPNSKVSDLLLSWGDPILLESALDFLEGSSQVFHLAGSPDGEPAFCCYRRIAISLPGSIVTSRVSL